MPREMRSGRREEWFGSGVAHESKHEARLRGRASREVKVPERLRLWWTPLAAAHYRPRRAAREKCP